MEMVAPVGPVYQAGTLSGNPLAMTAGLATLTRAPGDGLLRALERSARELAEGVTQRQRRRAYPCRLNRLGSLMTFFFDDGPVTDYASARRSDTRALRPLLPRDAEARRVPAAVAVRVVVRVGGAQRGATSTPRSQQRRKC